MSDRQNEKNDMYRIRYLEGYKGHEANMKNGLQWPEHFAEAFFGSQWESIKAGEHPKVVATCVN